MVRLLPLLAACVLASGCFVFDEIDKGQAILEQHSPKKPAKAAQSAQPPAQAGPKTGSAWWSSARTLDTGPSDSASAGDPNTPVACQVDGATRFMRRGDCLSQGGRPTS